MVELYCELLLARANVLDQLAFGERGVEMRSRSGSRNRGRDREGEVVGGGVEGDGKGKAKGSSGLFGFLWGGQTQGQGQGQGQKKESPPSPVSSSEGVTTTTMQTEPEVLESPDMDIIPDPTTQPCYLDPAIDEAAIAIFYSWPRFPHDVRELTMLRTLLVERYGKEFMTLAQENKADIKVPERLVKRLMVRAPTKELVESYLREIAKAYGVSWPVELESGVDGSPPPLEFVDDHDHEHGDTTTNDNDNSNNGDGDGDMNLPSTPPKRQQTNELSKATPPTELGQGRSPVSVSPPGPRSDNLNPRVRFPRTASEKAAAAAATAGGGTRKSGSAGNGIPELDELTRRFAALKR